MRSFKWLGWSLGLMAVLLASIIVGGYLYLRSTTPEYNGSIIADGITAEVEIIRDTYGMPHIYAATDEDACFALGYCTAQDRLFQMDMIRRTVRGRLSEVIGEEVLDVDRLFRIITPAKSADDIMNDLSPEVISMIKAYSAGINRFINDKGKKLPFEFALLGYEPEPWRPDDCLTVLYYMAWGLNFAFDTELLHAAVTDKAGLEMAAEIFIDYPPGAPTILPEHGHSEIHYRLLETVKHAREFTGATFRGASNNWVVSGKKSATDLPLLANDMHLGFMLPGIWYEAHLAGPNLNVSGVVIPGAPFIVAGANRHVAWGFTNVMADEADFYVEKINPENPGQYKYIDRWKDIEIRHDTIDVKGGPDVTFDIRSTRHGPIIDDIIPNEDTIVQYPHPIAMRWTVADFDLEAEALCLLNRAKNIDDIEKAAVLHKCPGQNWVYADDQGNIGYYAAVGIPIRKNFDGRTLLPGWDGQHEWSGYVPAEKQPHVRNLSRGYIATANNKPEDDDYPYYISHCYAPADRFIRITETLNDKEKLTIDDFKRMQGDEYLVMAENWVPRIIAAVESMTLTETEKQALECLENWDYHASAGKAAPAVFHVIFQNAIERIFRERLGEKLYEYFLSEGTFTVHKAMQNLFNTDQSEWFDNPTTESIETLDSVLVDSFADAVIFLSEKFGDNVDEWRWGKLHTLTLYHPIGRHIPLLGNLMNIGPHPMGGGINSVNAAVYRLSNPYAVVAGASQRHIFDLGNMKNSLRSIPAGISGNFMSRHYDDQFNLWSKAEYRPFVLDPEDVEKEAAYILKIIPAMGKN
jgi:penicillin amidase